MKNGAKKTVQKKLFPGYVLVNMIMNDDTWYVVRNTRGVTGFVGPGSKPVPLSEAEMKPLGIKSDNVSIDFTLGALGVLDTFCSFDILCKLLSKATRRRQRSIRTHHGNYFVSLCVVCFLQNLQYFLVSILSGCAFLSLVVL